MYYHPHLETRSSPFGAPDDFVDLSKAFFVYAFFHSISGSQRLCPSARFFRVGKAVTSAVPATSRSIFALLRSFPIFSFLSRCISISHSSCASSVAGRCSERVLVRCIRREIAISRPTLY